MKCINKSHPDYKALIENSGLNPTILNAKIMVYQEENSTDEFPKINELGNIENVSRLIDKKNIPQFSFHSGNKVTSTSKQELIKLVKSNNSTISKVASKLLRSNKEIKINFISVPESDNLQYNGIYKANVNEIYINKNAIGSREKYDAVILEEIIHAETVYYLNSNTNVAKSWYKMYDKAKLMLSDYWKESNELKNKEEFLSAVLINTELQKALSNLPSINTNPYRNLWIDIIQFFAELFKFSSSERNLFKDLFDLASSITENSIDSDILLNTEESFMNNTEDIPDTYIDELSNKFNTIASSIEKRDDGYYINNKKIEKRVTDIVSLAVKAKYNFAPRSEEDSELDKVKAESGTYVHDFIQNSILRAVGTEINLPKFKNKIQENIYQQVEKFTKGFLSQFGNDNIRVFTELKVYDKDRNLAGTLDLVIITSDGTVHIYDWKTTSFRYDYKTNKVLVDSVPFYKEFYYKKQLGEYAKILKDAYGVKNFGDVRAFPIRTIFDSKKLDDSKVWSASNKTEYLKSIEGLNFNDASSKLYLRPVISDVERTGNPKLDRLLEILIKRRDKIQDEKIKNGTPEEIASGIERKNKRLDEIKESIINIQFLHSIDTFVDNIDNEIKNAETRGVNNLSNSEIEELESHIQFYTTELISLIDDVVDDKDESKRINNNINKVIAKSVRLKEAIVADRKTRVLGIGENVGIDNINEVQKETGWWGRSMRSFSQQNHPKIKALYQLVFKSKDNTEKAHNELNNEIQSKLTKLIEWGKTVGLTGNKLFDKMLKVTPSGALRLASKYRSEYYDKLKTARDNQDLIWLKKNTVFNKEAFDESLKGKIEVWKKIYEGNKDADKKIEKKIADYKKNYSGETGLINVSNFFVKPSDIWISDEFKYIQNNQPLKEFYDYFVEKTDEFRHFMGMTKDAGFVWAVQKDFIDSVFENGLGAFKGMGSILSQLESNPHQSVGMINEETGKIELSIPRYFINPKQIGNNKIDSSNQSKDLGRILSLAGAMAYNYKHMSEIKESVDILQQSLAPSENEVVLTDGNGNSIKDKVTGELRKAFGSSSTLEQFNDYMNYYLYGQKFKDTKDITFSLFGTKVSGLKTYNWVAKWYVGKSLSLNSISIIANLFGGNVNAAFIGAKSRYYDNNDYVSSIKQLSSKDKKAYSAIGFFDIIGQNETWKKANDLSVSSLTKNLTYDKLFFGQRAGDWQVRNSVLLSMLKSHTIKDGLIIRKQTEDKSLYDLIELKDDKFNLNVSDVELSKFRRKVITVGERILGNSSRDDIRLLNMTLVGKSMMMFRNWIPTLVDERFGALRENQDLGDYEMGRYRNFWAEFNNKKYLPVVRQVMGSLRVLQAYGLFGYGGKISESSKEVAKELYSNYLQANPDIKITEQEFIQMHYENLRANGLEMWMMSALILMMVALSGGDDDKNKSSLRRYAIKQMERNLNELSFFYSKSSFDALVKSPFPITGALQDVSRFVGAALNHTEEIITGDKKAAKGNEIGRATMKFFPTLSGIESFLSTAIDTWGKDEPSK